MKVNLKKIFRYATFIVICILMLPCLALTLFAFNINPPNKVINAKQKWTEANIHNYEIQYNFGSYSNIGSVYVNVEDDNIIQIEGNDTINGNRNPMDTDPIWYIGFSKSLPSNLSYYSVDKLFDWWEHQETVNLPFIDMCAIEDKYYVRFNEKFGYIEELSYTTCGKYDIGLGLLCPRISHCSFGMNVQQFQILDKTE